MTEKCGPFKAAASGDTWQETDWGAMMRRLFQDGVFFGYLNALDVVEHTPSADMSVDVKTGGAWVQGHWYVNDALKVVTIDAADATLYRTDRVVLRLTYDSPNSEIELAVIKSALAGASPAAPALTQDLAGAGIWEISLAQIAVLPAATSITTARITPEASYCAPAALGKSSVGTGTDGELLLSAAPSVDLGAATKKYVDDEIAGLGNPDPSGNPGKIPRVKSDESGYELFVPLYFVTASASDTTQYTNSTTYTVASPADNVYEFSFTLPQNHNKGGTYRIVTALTTGLVTLKYGVNSNQVISDGSQDIVIPCGGGAVIDVYLARISAADAVLSSFVIKCTETLTAPAW